MTINTKSIIEEELNNSQNKKNNMEFKINFAAVTIDWPDPLQSLWISKTHAFRGHFAPQSYRFILDN